MDKTNNLPDRFYDAIQLQTLLTNNTALGFERPRKRNPKHTRAPRRERSYGSFHTFGGNNILRDDSVTRAP